MPTYQYACTSCDNRLEAVQSFSDDALTECPACQGKLRKLYSAVGIVFKGSGFYRNDSRAAAKSEAGAATSASANGSTAKPDSAKSDSAKSDSAKADSGKSDSGKSDSGGGSGSAKSESGGTAGSSTRSTDSAKKPASTSASSS